MDKAELKGLQFCFLTKMEGNVINELAVVGQVAFFWRKFQALLCLGRSFYFLRETIVDLL